MDLFSGCGLCRVLREQTVDFMFWTYFVFFPLMLTMLTVSSDYCIDVDAALFLLQL